MGEAKKVERKKKNLSVLLGSTCTPGVEAGGGHSKFYATKVEAILGKWN